MERTLDDAVQRTANPIPETDEVLWTDFETAFKTAWTDTLSKQHAYQQLVTLAMSEDDIDAYIATFERLALVAGWHRDANGTVEFFRKGLTHSILRSCLLRTTIPETMTEWQDAARAETQRARTLASYLPQRPTGFRKPQHTFYNHAAPVPQPTNTSSNGVVPMDIDAIATKPWQPSQQRLAPLTDAERERCKQEGRCFCCRQQGHVAIRCPMKTYARIPLQTNAISFASPVATPATQPAAQTAAATAMTHILGLDEQDQQTVINNLLLMGMGGFTPNTPSIATPQINAIGLHSAPSRDTPFRVNAMQLDLAPGTAIPTPVPSPFRADLASLSLTDSPPPRPPRSPRRPCSPRISPPSLPIVVEDDNASGRGVKTSSSASVFTLVRPTDEISQHAAPAIPRKLVLPTSASDESPPLTPPPRLARSPRRENRSIFPPNAFERPRDPDEVVPQEPRPTVQYCRANAADVAPPQPDTTRPVVTHDRDQQNHNTRHSKRRDRRIAEEDIRAWLRRIVYDPPPRPRSRPRPSLETVSEERVDPELREYGYDYAYEDSKREG
ncbi:hypothetical protein EDB86DRAFT_2914769 [Lactarius hatsudake]|nr:hypothetical protein EDB86DRAFT_2914769 [Lactarius hatsudake]